MSNPFRKDRRLPFNESGDLEGDYGNYIYRWTLTFPQLQGVALTVGFHVDDLRDLLYIFYDDGNNDNRFGVYNLNTQVQVFISPALANYTPTIGSNVASSPASNLTAFNVSCSRQRYILLARNDGITIEVWKDGAMIFTYNINALNPANWIQLIHLSGRGKWIIINWNDDNYIFEGV